MIRQAAGILALALISLGLLYLLAFHAGLTWPAVLQAVGSVGWAAFACVLVLTAANLAFGTTKWLRMTRALAPGNIRPGRFVDAMLTTTLGALLGQIMPVHLGVALTRSLAGRLGVGGSPALNFGATVSEQLFDALILFIVGVISVLGLILSPSPGGWAALILLTATAGVFSSVRFLRLPVVLVKWLSALPFIQGPHPLLPKLSTAASRIAELSPSAFALQIGLSALRYVAMLLRAIIVLGALGMSAFAISAVIAFPLVQTIGLLPITPGNLGVIEWTWSGVLVYAGAAVNAAALFAVTLRIVTVAAQATLLMLLMAFRLSLSRLATSG